MGQSDKTQLSREGYKIGKVVGRFPFRTIECNKSTKELTLGCEVGLINRYVLRATWFVWFERFVHPVMFRVQLFVQGVFFFSFLFFSFSHLSLGIAAGPTLLSALVQTPSHVTILVEMHVAE